MNEVAISLASKGIVYKTGKVTVLCDRADVRVNEIIYVSCLALGLGHHYYSINSRFHHETRWVCNWMFEREIEECENEKHVFHCIGNKNLNHLPWPPRLCRISPARLSPSLALHSPSLPMLQLHWSSFCFSDHCPSWPLSSLCSLLHTPGSSDALLLSLTSSENHPWLPWLTKVALACHPFHHFL